MNGPFILNILQEVSADKTQVTSTSIKITIKIKMYA